MLTDRWDLAPHKIVVLPLRAFLPHQWMFLRTRSTLLVSVELAEGIRRFIESPALVADEWRTTNAELVALLEERQECPSSK